MAAASPPARLCLDGCATGEHKAGMIVTVDQAPAISIDGAKVPYPAPSSQAISSIMRSNRRSDTALEVRVRSELHRRGARFRKQHLIAVDGVRARVGIVFPRKKLAVFLDGCFWHRCPIHGNSPRANSEYWSAKLDHNVERDQKVASALDAAGWRVLRIWEHIPAEEAACRVIAVLIGIEASIDG